MTPVSPDQLAGDEGKEVGEVIDCEEGEPHPRQRIATPDAPTVSQMADHRVTHFPYRCWCPHCVEGFAREYAHRDGPPASVRYRSFPSTICS